MGPSKLLSPEGDVNQTTLSESPALLDTTTVLEAEEVLLLRTERDNAAEELLQAKKVLHDTQFALQTLLEINADMEKSMAEAEADLRDAKIVGETNDMVGQATPAPALLYMLLPPAAR